MPNTLSALEHLRRFRATFNDDEQVDEESELVVADLDLAIAALAGAPVVWVPPYQA